MLLRTRLSVLALVTSAIAAFVTGALVWHLQNQHDEHVQRLLINSQKLIWERVANTRAQKLEAAVRSIQSDRISSDQIPDDSQWNALLQNASPLLPVFRIALFDSRGQALMTKGDAEESEHLLPTEALERILRGDIISGAGQLFGQRYLLFSARRVGAAIVIVSAGIDDLLHDIRPLIEGDVFVLSLRGHEIAGTRPGMTAELGTSAMIRGELVRAVVQGGNSSILVSTVLSGWDGRPLANLVTLRAESALRAEGSTPATHVVAMVLVLGALAATLLWFYLRTTLRPLARSVRQLDQLASGNTALELDDPDLDADDEIGHIHNAVNNLRDEMQNLAVLREENVRIGKVQARIIRDELQKLAAVLDPQTREEVFAALSPEQSLQKTHELTRLALVMAKLTDMIGSQHTRLLGLLDELRAALAGKEALAKLQRELEIAARLQSLILPRESLCHPAVEIAAAMIPAEEVGGDFYDYFLLDSNTLGLVIADVSGKGIPAAFFMAVTRTLLRSYAELMPSARDCIIRLNDQLCDHNEEMMFVTLFFAIVDLESGAIRYVNAGHNPPVHLSNSAVMLPKGQNPALAVIPGINYFEGRLRLAPGDMLFLYTDGITEATDCQQRIFGETAMCTVLEAHRQDVEFPARMIEAIRKFENGAKQADDITLLALTFHGPSGPP